MYFSFLQQIQTVCDTAIFALEVPILQSVCGWLFVVAFVLFVDFSRCTTTTTIAIIMLIGWLHCAFVPSEDAASSRRGGISWDENNQVVGLDVSHRVKVISVKYTNYDLT